MAILAYDDVMLREPRLLVPRAQPLNLMKFAIPVPPTSYGVIKDRYVNGTSYTGFLVNYLAWLESGPGGLGLANDGGISQWWVGPKFRYAVPGALTIVLVFSTTATSGPDFVAGEVDNATNYIEDVCVNSANESYSAGSAEFTIRSSGGTMRRAYTGNIGLNDGKLHCIVWRVVSATEFDCYMDGVKITLTYPVTGTLPTESGTTEYPVWFCVRNVRGIALSGSDPTQRIYAYFRLTMLHPDPAGLSRNPYQLVAPT